MRYCLPGPTSYFVHNGGSDTAGDGSSGNPWATPQHAANFILSEIDLAGYPIDVYCGDSNHAKQTYPGLSITGQWVGATGNTGSVVWHGDTLYSNACVFAPGYLQGQALSVNSGCTTKFQDIDFDMVGYPGCDAVSITDGAAVDFGGVRADGSVSTIRFDNIVTYGNSVANGLTVDSRARCFLQQSVVWIENCQTQAVFFASDYGIIRANTNGVTGLVTINHGGLSTVTQGYAAVFNGVVSLEAVTFNGSVQGPQYYGVGQGIIDKYNTTLPGSSGGIIAPGSYIYVR